jgi:predicted GNAT family acetyltransferase
MAEESLQVRKNPTAQRFEILSGESLAVLEYEEENGRVTLVHTEVPVALEGRGIAGRLAVAAFEDARERNMTVSPVCDFVVSYIKRHPEYLPLVDPSQRARLS